MAAVGRLILIVLKARYVLSPSEERTGCFLVVSWAHILAQIYTV